MAQVRIKVNDKATPYIKRITTRIPIEAGLSGWNMAQKGAKLLKRQARIAGIKDWRRKLLSRNGIKAKKLSKFTYGVQIPLYGVKLDSMRPHKVALKPGRLITQWARDKGIKARVITVRPHPFIEAGWRNLVNSIPTELERMINKILR